MSAAPESFMHIDNGAGFSLSLKCVRPNVRASACPVILVPGYGMNSFIFGFHPGGASLEAHLASRGLEVWSCDLRGQGRTENHGGNDAWSFHDLAVTDLGAVIRAVLERTDTNAREACLVGCSLGAALSFAHLACVPNAPVRALVSMAGVVTWKEVHPLVRAAFSSRTVAGAVRIRNTRALASMLLPTLAKRAPRLLSFYLNPKTTDLSRAAEMVQTVEDPVPSVNREIAHWIREKELVVGGVNVSHALAKMTLPFLCAVAMQDGVVPEATARATFEAIGSSDKELVLVGTRENPVAHGDLFVGRGMQELAFEPIARFLLRVGALSPT